MHAATPGAFGEGALIDRPLAVPHPAPHCFARDDHCRFEPLFEGRFYIAHYEGSHVVRIARTVVPLGDQAREEFERCEQAMAHLDRARTGLLVDVRDAPMRNDPAFESQTKTMRPALIFGFKHAAVLVRTAVGRLQIKRLNERDRVETPVFLDEAEALAHLHKALAQRTPAPVARR